MRISHHKTRKQKAQTDPDQITNREGHEERKRKSDKHGSPQARSSVETRPPAGLNC
jgi:hypothetical protein